MSPELILGRPPWISFSPTRLTQAHSRLKGLGSAINNHKPEPARYYLIPRASLGQHVGSSDPQANTVSGSWPINNSHNIRQLLHSPALLPAHARNKIPRIIPVPRLSSTPPSQGYKPGPFLYTRCSHLARCDNWRRQRSVFGGNLAPGRLLWDSVSYALA
ncbi:uncharacterized protein B0I36DRAFT_18936 [Microdochium trichocladiopsis]|uniref:Uncharacterized protein n=1 Tax=Microdochium trichocladiopsis TaxID=1682393 RepID=A0A9P9C0G1_9PEZI|nr:uncharacterized protein B0I36DRAFT_18936 [Microdochium trichocladiopsis]KAH7041069.1 hypothetical protein B0I36DRAFT_18936 [Microdochium trichocladiopsis]